MSGTSTVATPYANCKKRWGWVEIHWSDEQKENFKLDQYTCPKLSRYNIQDPLPDVAGVPEAYIKKDLKTIHDEFTSGAGADVSVDLHKKIVEKGTEFERKGGIICSAVTQWIIVEIQPITGIEWASIDALPSFDIWAFLQPRGIGSRSRMKKEYGYVSDDKPRAGWFSTEIRWFREKDPQSSSGSDTFVPRMSIKSMVGDEGQHDNAKIIRWQDVDVTLTDENSKSIKFHPKRQSYGKGLRFLFRIPITVKNVQSAQDRRNRVEAYNTQKKGGKLTEEQQRQLLRFEVGSYLKVWARNAAFPWDKDCSPRDDLTSDCMDSMQRIDNARMHPNERFNKPAASELRVSDYERLDYRAYIRAWHTTGQGMLNDLMKRAAQSAPPDRIGEIARMALDKPLNPLGLSDTTYKPLPEEDNETFLKPSDVACPDIVQEVDSETDKNGRYKCGNEFFRPYSFRNHFWKRNRFSESGEYEEDKWYYVALWPDELIESVENLSAYFFKDPSQGTFLSVGICMVVFITLYKGLYEIAELALDKASQTLDPDKQKDQCNYYRLIKAIMDSDDLATLAGAFSRHGFPDFNEGRWLDEENNKSIAHILSEYKTTLEKAKAETNYGEWAIYVEQVLQIIKSYFCIAVDVLEKGKKLPSVPKPQEFIDKAQSEFARISQLINSGEKTAPSTTSDKKKPFLKGPELSKVSILKGELELEMKEGQPRNKRLKAWPLPAPYLSWLAFVISLRSKGSLACKMATAAIKAVTDKARKPAILKLDLTAKGEEGIFFDLAAIWTLFTQLEDTFKKSTPAGKPGSSAASSFEFVKTLKKVLELADAQIGFGVKLTSTTKFPLTFDFDKLQNRQNFFSTLTGKPFSALMDLELPVTMKLSCISANLGTLKLPLVAASPSAIVICPNGVELQGSGMFAGKKEKVSSGKEWIRIQLGRGIITQRSHKLISAHIFKFGQMLQSEAHSLNIIPTDLMKKEGTEVPFFQMALIENGGSKTIELASKSVYRKPMLDKEVADSRILFESSLSLSQKQLKTDAAYAAFISKLLRSDQPCSLQVSWAGSVTEKQSADKTITLLSPRIDTFVFDERLYKVNDTVKITFHVTNFEYCEIPLYCKVYEYNKVGMFGKHDVSSEREIKRKDSKQGYFRCEPVRDDATKKWTGNYRVNIPFCEFGAIPEKGEDDDDQWELSLKISVDFEGDYPLHFSNGMGLSNLDTFSNKFVKLEKISAPKI